MEHKGFKRSRASERARERERERERGEMCSVTYLIVASLIRVSIQQKQQLALASQLVGLFHLFVLFICEE